MRTCETALGQPQSLTNGRYLSRLPDPCKSALAHRRTVHISNSIDQSIVGIREMDWLFCPLRRILAALAR